MANKLIHFLAKLATGKVIIALLLFVIAVNAFVLQAVYPAFDTLDMQPSYTPDQAYTLISSYGEQGRQYYTLIELTLDLAYPLVSALLFSTVAMYFFRRIFPLDSFVQKLPLLPLLVMAVDYLENICIVVMLQRFPQRLDGVAQAANLFTVTKFWLSWPELILVLVGVAGWVAKKVLPILKKRPASRELMAAPDRTLKSFIARKPLLSYFVLSYAFFWLALLIFITAVTVSGLKMDSLPSWAMPLILIVGSWMPTLAALIVTGITQGRGGIKQLLLSFTQFKLPARWYFAALIPLGLAFAAAGIYRLGGGTASGGVSLSLSFWAGLIAINIFTGATGEEAGWRGFALPRLLEKYSLLKAGILTGIAWNFWHLPLWFSSGFSSLNLVEYILFFSVAIISLAVLMTWIFCKSSKSLIPMAIAHFSFNTGFSLIGPQGFGLGPNLALMGILAALLMVTAIGVSLAGGFTVKVEHKYELQGMSQ